MRHAAQAIELDVVGGGAFAQHLLRFAPQGCHALKILGEAVNRRASGLEQTADPHIALHIVAGRAAFLHLGQAVVQGLDQQTASTRVVEQIVLQIGVALHHPNVAQHLVEHAR